MFANRVVKATVAALKILAANVPIVAFKSVVLPRVVEAEEERFVNVPVPPTIAEPEIVWAVRFVNVVLARVVEPVISKLAAVSVPLLVDELVIKAVSTAVCARRLVKVVEAKVELPVILKLRAVSVPEFVDEARLSALIAKLLPVMFVTVVEARVEDAEAMKFCALLVVALVVVASKVVICAFGVNRFVNEVVSALKILAKSVPLTLRLVIPEVAARN